MAKVFCASCDDSGSQPVLHGPTPTKPPHPVLERCPDCPLCELCQCRMADGVWPIEGPGDYCSVDCFLDASKCQADPLNPAHNRLHLSALAALTGDLWDHRGEDSPASGVQFARLLAWIASTSQHGEQAIGDLM